MGVKIEVYWRGSDVPWRIGQMHWILSSTGIDLFLLWPIGIMLAKR
jgi:hypothetical protein